MSIRRDLAPVPQALVNAAASLSGTHDAPRAAIEAIEAVGAQVKEHRAGIDQSMSELRAGLQSMQQVVAKFEGGSFSPAMHSPKSVSAQVLAEGESDIEALRDGRKKSVRMSLPSLHPGPSAAAITSDGLHISPERDTEVYGGLARAHSVRDLLVTRRTAAPAIEYLRSTRTGNAAIQAVEGDLKAEMAMNFTLHTAPVKTIACWVPASRQALDDSAMLGDYIDHELRDALKLTEDMQLLNGDGVGANMLGLATQASAYNRGQSGDTANDTLRRAITQIQLARGIASGIVINPEGLEDLELAKDNTGRYLYSVSVTNANGNATTWRVPTVVTDAVAPGKFLVGDFLRAARLYDRMQATVEVATEHADFFTRNLVAILAEERVALAVMRPDLLVFGEFA